MKTSLQFILAVLRRAPRLSLNPEPMDAFLSKWGSLTGGLILVILTVPVLASHASSRAEMLLGIGVALSACANLFLFGFLSRQVHLVWHRGVMRWRSRAVELVGLAIGIGIISAGIGGIPLLDLSPIGMLIGGLLILSLAMAIMCLGLWRTLSNAAKHEAMINGSTPEGVEKASEML